MDDYVTILACAACAVVCCDDEPLEEEILSRLRAISQKRQTCSQTRAVEDRFDAYFKFMVGIFRRLAQKSPGVAHAMMARHAAVAMQAEARVPTVMKFLEKF